MRGFRGETDCWLGEACTDMKDCECPDCTSTRTINYLEEYGDYLYEQEKDRRIGL